MSDTLWDQLDPAHGALLRRAVRAADDEGLPLYLVGGPVRDWLLGQPLRDLDLLLECDPDTLARLARALSTTDTPVEIHERFGTAHLDEDGAALDLASVRSERYARPGALPRVEPGTFDDDVRRRDFTINAMTVPLSRAARRRLPKPTPEPPVIDLGGGQDDLARGVLRVFHPKSFHDDPTRALRAARLSARLGFRLVRGSRNALDEAIRDGAFDGVSGDRIRREFERLLDDARLGVDPVRALVTLERWGVLQELCAGLSIPRAPRPALRRIARAVALPPWDLGDTRVWIAALAVWCEALPAGARKRWLARLAVRGARADWVLQAARGLRGDLARCARARGRGALDRELQGHTAEAWLALYAKADPPLRRRIVRWVKEDRTLRLPLGGRDLRDLALEGPELGAALAALRGALLDGKIATREEGLAFAREWAQQAQRRRRRASSGGRLPSGK